MLHVNIFIDTTGITNVKPLGGVMVSVLSSSVVDIGFRPVGMNKRL